MSDLISRRAAIKAIEDLPNCYNGYSDTYDKAYIIGMLEEVPTIDAVSVVRCKECKHFVISEGVCSLLSNNYEPPVYCGDEDFCSWGRRKERKGGAEE